MGQQVPEVLGRISISLDTPSDATALSRASFGVRDASAALATVGAGDRADPNEARYDPLASPPGSVLAVLTNDRQTSVCEAAVTGLSNALKEDLDQNREAFRHRLAVLKAVAAAAATHFEAMEAHDLAAPSPANPVDPDVPLGMACWSGALTTDDRLTGADATFIDKLDAAPYTATELQTAFAALDLRYVAQSWESDKPSSASGQAKADAGRKAAKVERAPDRQSHVLVRPDRGRDWNDSSYGDRAADIWDRKASDLLALRSVLAPHDFQAREVRLAALCTMMGKSFRRSTGRLKVKHLCQQDLPVGPMREQSLVLRATALCHLIDGAWHIPNALNEFLPALPSGGSGRDDAIALHAAVYHRLAAIDFDDARLRRIRYEVCVAQLTQLPSRDREALAGALDEAFN